MPKLKGKNIQDIIYNKDLRNDCATLFANIKFASIDEEIRSISIVSAAANEGKSIIAINMASLIAMSGKNVLIIETDMRKRSLARMFDIHPKYGLYGILSGKCLPEQAVNNTVIPNLYFLDSEPNVPAPPDILSSNRFAMLIDKLYQDFDYLIFDSPPMNTFIDGAIISSLCDAAVLVVRENFTKKNVISDVIKQLESSKANLVGSVLTFCKDTDDKKYYYAYYDAKHNRVDRNDDSFVNNEGVNNFEIDQNLSTWMNNSFHGKAYMRQQGKDNMQQRFGGDDNQDNNNDDEMFGQDDAVADFHRVKHGAHQTGVIR